MNKPRRSAPNLQRPLVWNRRWSPSPRLSVQMQALKLRRIQLPVQGAQSLEKYDQLDEDLDQPTES